MISRLGDDFAVVIRYPVGAAHDDADTAFRIKYDGTAVSAGDMTPEIAAQLLVASIAPALFYAATAGSVGQHYALFILPPTEDPQVDGGGFSIRMDGRIDAWGVGVTPNDELRAFAAAIGKRCASYMVANAP